MKVVADANELFSAVISKGRGWKSRTLDMSEIARINNNCFDFRACSKTDNVLL